jgi:hypothetical protein
MPTSRVPPPGTTIFKTHPLGRPDQRDSIAMVAGITTDAIEFWGDGAIWDTTTNKPICIDKLNITGTPRKVT